MSRKVNSHFKRSPDNKVHGANMGPTWVMSASDGPHVGPMNLLSGRVTCIWPLSWIAKRWNGSTFLQGNYLCAKYQDNSWTDDNLVCYKQAHQSQRSWETKFNGFRAGRKLCAISFIMIMSCTPGFIFSKTCCCTGDKDKVYHTKYVDVGGFFYHFVSRFYS